VESRSGGSTLPWKSTAALEISFEKKSLRELCENQDKASQSLGEKAADQLRRRLADLRAATSIADLVAIQPRFPDGETATLELCDGCEIVFRSNHLDAPKRKSGKLDWSRVTRIKIMNVKSENA
jgi:hypothetical protein